MPSKWDMARGSMERVHGDLFDGDRYTATLYGYTQGSYNPGTGDITGETRQKLGTLQVEIVPPGMDTTVDTDGTSLSWDTSIRFPYKQGSLTVRDGETYTVESGTTDEYEGVVVESGGTLVVDGHLIVYGDLSNGGVIENNGTVAVLGESEFLDAVTPLGVDSERPSEVEVSHGTSQSTVYELHGYSIERGSGLVRCRVVETDE